MVVRPQLIAIMLYVAALFALSRASASRSRDADEFLVAGRGMSWPVVACTIFGNVTGGAAVLGVAQTAYRVGIGAAFFNVGVTIGLIVLGFTLAGPFRRLKEVTVCEAIGHVYDRRVRNVSGVILSAVYVIVTCVQFASGGAILREISGMSSVASTLTTAALTLVIVFAGGLWAVARTNVLNALLIQVGLITGTVASVRAIGGWSALAARLPAEFLNPLSLGADTIVAWITTTMFTCLTAQAGLLAIFGARSERDAKLGALAGGGLVLPLSICAAVFGMVARATFAVGDAGGPGALPAVAATLPPLLSSFVFLSLWAVIISTSGPCLLAVVQMLIRDVAALISDKARAWCEANVRACTLIVGLACALLSVTVAEILGTLLFTFTVRSALAIGLLLAHLFGKRSRVFLSSTAALWAIILSTLATVLWVVFLKRPHGIHEFYPTAAVFVITMLAVGLTESRRSHPGLSLKEE